MAAVVTAPLPAAHAQTAQCQAGVERAAAAPVLLVQPIVNGEEREVGRVRFVAPGGPLYIDEPDLVQWGVATDKLTLLDFSGARWLCVEGLGLKYELNSSQLTLALDFPPELHVGSRTSFVAEDHVPVTYTPGGFLNYDLRFDRTQGAGPGSIAADWEIGAFSRLGLFTSSFFSGNNDRGTIRLDTTLRRDDPDKITSLVLGDTITRPGSYGPAVRIAGLQYQRNFANAPLLITYPTANVTGTATVPSTVDVYIENAKAYSTQVKPGRVLGVEPAGSGRRRQRDGGGARRVRPGNDRGGALRALRLDAPQGALHDFSYEAGFLREDYAVRSNAYSDWAAVATHRYGVTDQLTIEGHAEGMADRANVGGVVQATVPVLGLVGVGAAASGGLGYGKLGKVFLPAHRVETGASLPRRSSAAATTSTSPSSPVRFALSPSASSRRRRGSASATG